MTWRARGVVTRRGEGLIEWGRSSVTWRSRLLLHLLCPWRSKGAGGGGQVQLPCTRGYAVSAGAGGAMLTEGAPDQM